MPAVGAAVICWPALAISAARSAAICCPLAIAASVGHLECRTVLRPCAAVVVDSRGGDVRLAEPFLNLGDVGLVIERIRVHCKELAPAGVLLRRSRTARPLHRGILSPARRPNRDGRGRRRVRHHHRRCWASVIAAPFEGGPKPLATQSSRRVIACVTLGQRPQVGTRVGHGTCARSHPRKPVRRRRN